MTSRNKLIAIRCCLAKEQHRLCLLAKQNYYNSTTESWQVVNPKSKWTKSTNF